MQRAVSLQLVKSRMERKKEYPTLRYRVLLEDSFESPIVFLQRLLAVALDRRPAWHRVLPLNSLSPRTHWLVTRAGECHT
jgi:hypothetical protein